MAVFHIACSVITLTSGCRVLAGSPKGCHIDLRGSRLRTNGLSTESAMVLLTTEAVRPRERFAYWREVVSQHFVHLRPERVAGGLFHGEIRAKILGGLSVSQVMSGGQRVLRTAAEIARSPAP